jgi:hypothetical protein
MPDVKLAQHFEVGAKVGVWPRSGDLFPGVDLLGKPVKTLTMSDGAEVKGLDEGRYWAARTDGEQGHVAFTAKDTPAPKQHVAAPTTADPQRTPLVHGGVEIHVGPRGTKVGGRVIETPIGRGQEAHPSLNQASVGDGVWQRSATPLGQATPVDPGELQPKPSQQDVKKGARQRSATELGESTEIADEAGPIRQEDYKGPQRSDTETGEATPIGSAEPRGTSVNPSSVEQAEGVRPTDGDKPERSAKSDTEGPNPEIAAEGRTRPRGSQRQSRKR